MSDWLVHLVQIAKVGHHPNADKLDITQIYGQSVICQRDLYKMGDLAVFLPPDSVLSSDPENVIVKDSGLKPGHCIEAKRLRGIFSNGMLVPASVCFTPEELAKIAPGTHVAERLGITKYEPPIEKLGNTGTGGDNESDPGYMPCYTDLEGWPKYRDEGIIAVGEPVVLTEKIHGANARFTFRDGRLWVGSRNGIKKEDDAVLWWRVAKELNLEARFQKLLEASEFFERTVIYGEVYGQVQDLRYGVDKGATFRLFDTFDTALGRYNDWNNTKVIATIMGLDLVPELYVGPWAPELEELRNGPSVLYPGHTREGFVVKPLKERHQHYDPEKRNLFTGRVIFKFVGEDYKTRKKK
jgi:RNA ligase (TIGR02306 family)